MRWPALLLATALACGLCAGQVSQPGGAGHALLFKDHAIVLENFKDLSEEAITFEAWVSTSDYCHDSALFSYAVPSHSGDVHQQTVDNNHFVIFDLKKLVACHDFEYIDLFPDQGKKSCYSAFNGSSNPALPSYVERDGRWHHLAVSWTRAGDGLTKIYWDGLLKVQAATGKTGPLRPGGALMLGAEQDCYGGCVDEHQGYYGLLDEVRIWRTARTQSQIIQSMRSAAGLEGHADLAAYWKFDDPQEVGFNQFAPVARDHSGRGNHLPLVRLPEAKDLTISRAGKSMRASALSFRNNYLMNQGFTGMPDKSFTIEFWARTPAYDSSIKQDPRYTQSSGFAELFSFAATLASTGGRPSSLLMTNAILIEKYMTDFDGKKEIQYQRFSTRGAVSVHVNDDRKNAGGPHDNWIDFDTKWVDGEWHHLAVTWDANSGEVHLYLDGEDRRPFRSSNAGITSVADPARGSVSNRIAVGGQRSADGSLVLGQKQDCLGGCFSAHYGMRGDLANVRIWSRVLGRDEVARGMFEADPTDRTGLVSNYKFDAASLIRTDHGPMSTRDSAQPTRNELYLQADAPLWQYSDAPLAEASGRPVAPPQPGSGGYAMHLGDRQVLIAKDFQDFPSEEVTVEFWMLSTDSCRKGTPFSYATGSQYGVNDNSFTVFGYNDFGVAVMEDEGTLADHTSGVAATDGRWHHIAATWRSMDGVVKLYDNGREVWSAVRGRGRKIPSGGTLVVGREQDCEGGCFDSAQGAAGSVDVKQEYGAEDFFGLIDDLRIWKKARTAEQIMDGMRSSLFQKGSTGERYASKPIDRSDPDLVAYFNFDEGTGYTVTDVTGKGHDLKCMEAPRWEVVRSLAVCGNGVLEGLEECDDGDIEDGDGCSAGCKIESGWQCTKTGPSSCWRSGTPAPPTPTPGPPSSGGGGSGTGAGAAAPPPKRGGPATATVAGSVLGVAAFAVIAATLLAYREQVYDRFPQVERGVASLSHRLGRMSGGYGGYAPHLGLGEDEELAADFTSPRPAPARGDRYERLPSEAAGPLGAGRA